MDREELRNVLQGLFDKFNLYVKLYTIVEGEIYIHEAYDQLAKKFGKNVEDYESRVMSDSSEEKQKISDLKAEYEDANKRIQKLTKKVDFEEQIVGDGKDGIKNSLMGVLFIAVVFWIIQYFFKLAIIGVILMAWFGVKIIQATGLDNHRAQLQEAKREANNSLQQCELLVTGAESDIWSAEFEAFCNRPENAKSIEQAEVTTGKFLIQLKSIDFNDYNLLPSKYQDNISVQKSLDLLDTGRADNWKDCVQIMEQESFQKQQFEEMKRQTKNQEHIISNQEQMINNQEDQINSMNVLNKNVQEINEGIKNLATTIERQGTAVKRRMDVVAINQGRQMFQSREFHKEQLEAMKDSTDALAKSAYMSPAYYQYNNGQYA